MKKHARRLMVPTLLAAAALLAGCGSMLKPGDGWETLIDGVKGLDNFTRMGGANWRTDTEGILADARPDTTGAHYLTTKTTYRDFHLRAEFWVSADANSGIYVRCNEVRPMTDRSCYEANIFDRRPDPTYATGGIVWIAKTLSPVPLAGGKWNTMEVIARGKTMTVMLNGVKTAESSEIRDDAGVIGLQYGGGTVKWRKLQIKRL